jgi:hypothetical protein
MPPVHVTDFCKLLHSTRLIYVPFSLMRIQSKYRFHNPKRHLMRQNLFRAVFLTVVCLVILLALQPLPEAYAATILVTNTDDSGTGSLRAAIITANASPMWT